MIDKDGHALNFHKNGIYTYIKIDLAAAYYNTTNEIDSR